MTSDQLDRFFRMRDEAIEGLANCDVMLNRAEVLKGQHAAPGNTSNNMN